MSNKTINYAINNSEPYVADKPRPLMREFPPATPFPVDALGTILGGAANAIHSKVQAPLAIGGQSVLAAATLAVQGYADIELPTGQKKPISNFFVTNAESGERKTSCDDEALLPIRKMENILREKFDAEYPPYQNDYTAWEKAKNKITNDKKLSREATKAALDTLGLPPEMPLQPLLTCQDPTFEGLCLLYSIGMPSLGIFSNEGGQFIGGHGMNNDNKLRTATALSMLWDGEPVKRVRRGDGISTLYGRRLAVHLMVQPDVASIMLSDPLLNSQGLLSRILVSAPDTAAGTRFWKDTLAEDEISIKKYSDRLLNIMETPMPLAEGKNNELNPRRLLLSQKSRKLWIDFADRIEVSIAPNGKFGTIRGLANKLPEHAARLAAIPTLVNDIYALEISEEQMAAGIELAMHYANEALRLFGVSRINADLLLSQKLLVWLQTSWKEQFISLPDIYQRSPIIAIRDKHKSMSMVKILEGHGYLHRVNGEAIVAGEKRREVWQIVRCT